MKRYTMSFADGAKHTPEHPERTAKRSISWDVEYQVWTNRPAMAKTIRMQQKKAGIINRREWIPCVPLTDGEGY